MSVKSSPELTAPPGYYRNTINAHNSPYSYYHIQSNQTREALTITKTYFHNHIYCTKYLPRFQLKRYFRTLFQQFSIEKV